MQQPEQTVEELLAEIKRILEAPDDIDPAVLASPKMSAIAGIADIEIPPTLSLAPQRDGFVDRWLRETRHLEDTRTRTVRVGRADHPAVDARIDNVIYVRFGGSPY